jgi:peroxiredoxin
LAAKYADKGLVLVGPSLDAEATVKTFKAKHEIGYPLLAGAAKTAHAFGVQAYPTIFLVGKDGKVIWKGHFEDEVFIKKLEEALGAGAAAPAAPAQKNK